MANQMIALQTRGPQLADPSKLTAQYANMMNMASQQRAAQLQGERTRQEMEFAKNAETRAASKFSLEQSTALVSALGTGMLNILADPSDESIMQAGQTFASVGMEPDKFGPLLKQVQEIPDANDRKLFVTQFISQSEPARAALKFVMPDVKETKIGDDTVFTDNNATSPTFGQELFRLNVAPEPVNLNQQVVGEKLFNVNPRTGIAAEALIGDPNQGLTPAARPANLISSGARSPYMVGGGTGQQPMMPPAAPTAPPAQAVGTPRAAQRGAPGQGNTADVVYGFGKFGSPNKPLSTMPIGEVQKFQRDTLIPNTRGKIGAGSDKGTGAVGTYQFTYGTLKQYAPKVLGPNWRNVPFTADVQEQLAKALYEDVKGGDLKKTWAGLPSNRPGQYANVPWENVRDDIIRVESAGGGTRRASTGGTATPTGAGTGTPITVSDSVKLPGKKRVTSIVSDMIKEYNILNDAKAIPSSERGAMENIFDYVSVSGPGKEIQKAFGTKANDSLSNIANARKLLTSAIAAATGMSSKQMDSNRELQLTLDSLSDPTQGYKAIIDTLMRLDREYGLGTAPPRTPTGGGQGKGKPPLKSFRRK
jgi:hypothetical protein